MIGVLIAVIGYKHQHIMSLGERITQFDRNAF